MLLKSADDKSERLSLLEDLQQSKDLDAQQKKWISQELQRCKKGIRGESESAHYLDSYFKDGENHVVLHDLRLVVDGEVAQIDHLILNRTGHFFLIETKNYAGDLIVNDRGEFTVQYDHDTFGIPSPWEQSRRHERILAKLLPKLGISGRTDKLPDFHHLVMMHPKAIIRRPDSKAFDTSFLIKADQFPSWHGGFADKVGAGILFKALLNVRSRETILEWGEKLKRQHQPADQLTLPDFITSRIKLMELPGATPQTQPRKQESKPGPVDAGNEENPAKKLICTHCGIKITYPEGKFCWNNSKRFGGLQYCREHQSLF